MKFKMQGIGSELKDNTLAVPVYQRSYAWDKQEVSEYWDDLVSAFNRKSDYFLGTSVLTTEADGKLTIIDGQQRLATTAMLFAAIRDQFTERNDAQRGRIIQNDFLSSVDRKSF